jgi:hypothetical protein
MNNQSRWLIDHDQIIVFEKHVERDLLWHRLKLLGRRFGELNLVTAANNLAWSTA